MSAFVTRRLPATPDVVASDGSDVRVLAGLGSGGMAHFTLPAAQTSPAVAHRTVEEIWFVVSGRGEMWRKLGTHFQFRAHAGEPLAVIGITMPPWPGDAEAFRVAGPWTPTVRA